MSDTLRETWQIFIDPAHAGAEVLRMLVIDGVLIGLLWRPWLRRRLDREHRLLDEEHGHKHPE